MTRSKNSYIFYNYLLLYDVPRLVLSYIPLIYPGDWLADYNKSNPFSYNTAQVDFRLAVSSSRQSCSVYSAARAQQLQ